MRKMICIILKQIFKINSTISNIFKSSLCNKEVYPPEKRAKNMEEIMGLIKYFNDVKAFYD
jgi:hypothetical protein